MLRAMQRRAQAVRISVTDHWNRSSSKVKGDMLAIDRIVPRLSSPDRRSRRRRAFCVVTGLVMLVPAGAHGLQEVSFDQSTLAMERPAMSTLLEKTLFKVDVARLELWFTPRVLAMMEALAEGQGTERRDSIADLATHATDALARLRFERNVGLDQFLDGLQTSAGKASDAGIISRAAYEGIVAASPKWYAFLEGRNIREGDEMLYRIRGDTLRTVFQAADGAVLLDQRDVGAEVRLAVLGGYLAPGADFRRGLIDSVLNRTARGNPDP